MFDHHEFSLRWIDQSGTDLIKRRPAGRLGEEIRAGFLNWVNWNLETKEENYRALCITFNPLECKKKKVYQKAKMVDKIRDESTAGF